MSWLVIQLLLGVGACTGVAVWLGRPIFHDLNRLERVSSQIAAGDLSARSRVTTGPVRELSAQFDAMADQVEELVQSQRDLIAAVSHELRTPMARIRFLLETLRDADSDVERIDDELDVMDDLLGQLLQLASQDEPPLEAAAPELTEEVITRICDRLAGLTDADVTVTVEGELPIGQRAMELIVGNLVSNAIRHAKSRVTVTVTDRKVVVSDDGPGVPPQLRERVFEPFHTGDTARNRSLGGVGLGLALVRREARRWHGDVTITDAQAGGATFVVAWPEGAD